jgi:hypothetical protein
MRRLTIGLVALALSLTSCGEAPRSAAPPAPGTPENPLVGQVAQSSADGRVYESATSRGTAEQPATSAPGQKTAGAAPTVAAEQDGAATRSGTAEQTARSKSKATAKQKAARPGDPVSKSGNAPGYGSLVQGQTSTPQSRFTPCNLVTEREAAEIVGSAMQQPLEAPQGPTCIYRSRDGDSFITLAVQTVAFGHAKDAVRSPEDVTVGTRKGVCGKVGQPTLYVSLSGGRVLSVGAPCSVAKSFASTALRRL